MKQPNTSITKLDLIPGGSDHPPAKRPGYEGLKFERRSNTGVTLVFKSSGTDFRRRIEWGRLESAEDILDLICSAYESGFKRGSDGLSI